MIYQARLFRLGSAARPWLSYPTSWLFSPILSISGNTFTEPDIHWNKLPPMTIWQVAESTFNLINKYWVMKWFEGPIPEAIKSAKEKGAVFVVYIYGKFLIPEVIWEFVRNILGFLMRHLSTWVYQANYPRYSTLRYCPNSFFFSTIYCVISDFILRGLINSGGSADSSIM